MIASRKLDRLEQSAEKMSALLPAGGSAKLEFMQCNIRNEEEVSDKLHLPF